MLIQADARSIPLRDRCVQCVVTSPPYWGLRDYGIEDQIGLEATPAAYVANLVQVFAEVRRVLTADGVLWLNLGDCYATGAGAVGDCPGGGEQGERWKARGPSRAQVPDGKNPNAGIPTFQPNRMPLVGLKPKDLTGIPWRVAFALQADGWYLRSDIIWSKPNPMPESVTDRPTKAHEYLFLLTKSERYFYDADAIREPFSEAMLNQIADGYHGDATKDYEAAGAQNASETKRSIIDRARALARHQMHAQNGRVVNAPEAEDGEWVRAEDVFDLAAEVDATLNAHRSSYRAGSASSMHDGEHVRKSDAGLPLNAFGRNKRTVWTIPTMPYAGAHFATMPEKLVEPCILAGSRLGDLIFDPFIGSGTVGAVAERLGRRWVGTDLNPAYLGLAKQRTLQRGLTFHAPITAL